MLSYNALPDLIGHLGGQLTIQLAWCR